MHLTLGGDIDNKKSNFFSNIIYTNFFLPTGKLVGYYI